MSVIVQWPIEYFVLRVESHWFQQKLTDVPGWYLNSHAQTTAVQILPPAGADACLINAMYCAIGLMVRSAKKKPPIQVKRGYHCEWEANVTERKGRHEGMKEKQAEEETEKGK